MSNEKKSTIKNIRFSSNDIKRADFLLEYLNEEMGLNLNFSDLICMLIKSEYNKQVKKQLLSNEK